MCQVVLHVEVLYYVEFYFVKLYSVDLYSVFSCCTVCLVVVRDVNFCKVC